jgi:hypothetical protein
VNRNSRKATRTSSENARRELKKMRPKHLRRYMREFARRRNIRDLDTIVQAERHIRCMVGKRLRYRDLTAK